ncbi:MAG: aspartate kinase [Armatimonadetes bacterium]|nr:aspartate kinase [Armatimonadota bacterium]MDW8122912.1 aspartate kinase [Armatimonadota bacterium]
MGIIVQKFGGTSVFPKERLLSAAQKVVKAKREGNDPVVVVSAPGRKGDPYATDTLIRNVQEIDPQIPVDKRELDLVMTCGEIIGIVWMAQAIKAVGGYKTIALTGGQAGIYTDQQFGNARIVRIDPTPVEEALKAGFIPVVAGFQGVTEHGHGVGHGQITTLGRGGSDTTAGALAAALNAQSCIIYTDVDGVLTADPRLVGAKARLLPSVTYEEVSEMAHLGARVVHPRCVEIAMNHRIPVWVRNAEGDREGTVIKERASDLPTRMFRITGITHLPQVAQVKVSVAEQEDLAEVETEIYRLLGEAGMVPYFVSKSRSFFEFAVVRHHLELLRSLLDGLTLPISANGHLRAYILTTDPDRVIHRERRRLLQRSQRDWVLLDAPIEITTNCAIVSLVTLNTREVPGIMARILEAMVDSEVDILQVADAQHSVSCLIREEDMVTAVRVLHEHFRLDDENTQQLQPIP